MCVCWYFSLVIKIFPNPVVWHFGEKGGCSLLSALKILSRKKFNCYSIYSGYKHNNNMFWPFRSLSTVDDLRGGEVLNSFVKLLLQSLMDCSLPHSLPYSSDVTQQLFLAVHGFLSTYSCSVCPIPILKWLFQVRTIMFLQLDSIWIGCSSQRLVIVQIIGTSESVALG